MGCVSWIRSVLKAAIGEGPAQTFVEEEKQEGDFNSFGVSR
jgi:hypothetical protein